MKRSVLFYISFLFMVLLIVNGSIQAQEVSDPLPDGWFHRDVGEPQLPSKMIYNADEETYTISAGGTNVWKGQEEFHFVYFETEEDKEVVVRALDLEASSGIAKTFIMVRTSLEALTPMVYVEYRTNKYANIVCRPEATSSWSYGKNNYIGEDFPAYLKMVRQGKYIDCYYSKDGNEWRQLGKTLKIAMKGKSYMGIGVCSCKPSEYAKGVFDNLEVRDIEIPYKVTMPFEDKSVDVDEEKIFDLTTLFGHYIGDYWRIEAESTDENVVTVESYEEVNSAFEKDGGEKFFKKLKIRGVKPGLATIKLTSNVAGYKLSDSFIVEVNGEGDLVEVTPQWPTAPWTMDDIGTEDTLSMIEYDTTMEDRIRMATCQKQSTGTTNGCSFLYQQFENDDQLELTTYMDTVSNTGDGSFAGLMMRSSLENNAPFVAMQAGAFEGVKFSYRWDADREVTEIVDSEIKLPCWVKMRKYRDDFGETYFDVFHSYDGIYWKKHLRYPFPLELDGLNVYAGLTGTGGTKVNETRMCEQIFKNVDVKVNEEFASLNYVANIDDLREPMTISENPVSTSTDVTFKVVKPGQVVLAVYDSYGVVQEQILNEFKGVGEYTITYTPKKLKKEGVYLLRLATSDNHDYLKFVYKPE